MEKALMTCRDNDGFRITSTTLYHASSGFSCQWEGYSLNPDEAREMESTFRGGAGSDPSLTEEHFDAIRECSRVIFLVSEDYTASKARFFCEEMLACGTALLQAGGIAIKVESSGVSHAPWKWTELWETATAASIDVLNMSTELHNDEPSNTSLAAGISQGRYRYYSALYHAYVRGILWNPASEGHLDSVDFSSCGMHLLGMADSVVSSVSLDPLHGVVGDVDSDSNDPRNLEELNEDKDARHSEKIPLRQRLQSRVRHDVGPTPLSAAEAAMESQHQTPVHRGRHDPDQPTDGQDLLQLTDSEVGMRPRAGSPFAGQTKFWKNVDYEEWEGEARKGNEKHQEMLDALRQQHHGEADSSHEVPVSSGSGEQQKNGSGDQHRASGGGGGGLGLVLDSFSSNYEPTDPEATENVVTLANLSDSEDVVLSPLSFQGRPTYRGRSEEEVVEMLTGKAASLISAFNMYLLAECGRGNMVEGERFRTSSRDTWFEVTWHGDSRFPKDVLLCNNHGCWRLRTPTASFSYSPKWRKSPFDSSGRKRLSASHSDDNSSCGDSSSNSAANISGPLNKLAASLSHL